MRRAVDVSGRKFGRLSVLHSERDSSGKLVWRWICDCGNTGACVSWCLTSGNTTSCGCYRTEKNGQRKAPEHSVERAADGSVVFWVGEGVRVRLSSEDEVLARRYHWSVLSNSSKPYIYRRASGRHVLLHREVLSRVGVDLRSKDDVDHVDGDASNNLRTNLRLATRSQNNYNRGATKANRCGYKGVSFDQRRGLWKARIKIGKKVHFLGRFDNLLEAVLAYDRAAYTGHGDFACGNYPRFACGLADDT